MEEKKLYDFVGTVIISTKEYRELIDERATFKCEAENAREDYWVEHLKVNYLKKEREKFQAERKKMQAEIEQFRAFVRESAALEDSYRNFCRDIGEAPNA